MSTLAESAATQGSTQVLPRPRAHVLAMPEYHPPLAGREALRLDFNENTLAPSPRVLAKLRELTAEGLTVYPEREPVERVVAASLGLDSQQIILTNGVDEAIHLVACAFLDEGDEALICTPTFFMYDVSISMMTSRLIRVQTDDTLAFPYERFLAAITPRTRLIIVASPNNPTGSVVSREHLLAIAAAAPPAVLMVDEAYFHFFGQTVIDQIGASPNHLPNLVVARTFSKAYGLAGLRLGLLAASREAMHSMRRVISPYSVNALALACLPAALADDAYLAWYVDEVQAARAELAAALTTLRVPFWPSQANFLLLDIGAKHCEFVRAMHERGILVRDRSSDALCQGCVRITIGPRQQMQPSHQALADTLTAIAWQAGESLRGASSL